MTTYSDIRGYRVKYLASDPTLNTSTEGQVWYNSTEGVLKSLVQIQAWSAGAPLLSPFGAQVAYGGTQTAAFYAGGTPGTTTLEYNGSGWSTGGAINTARYRLAGAGTLTAGLAFGGQNPTNTAMQTATEEYDGTNWTSNPTGLSTGRAPVGSAGTQTAGLAFGGRTGLSPPYGDTNATEEYNGSAWTAGGNLPNTILQNAGTGTQTATLSFGGAFPPASATSATNEYNGTSWTAGGNLNTARTSLGSAGIQTSALAFGGFSTSATENYDGSVWTTSSATLGTLTESGGTGPIGSSIASLTAGSPGGSSATEEYNSSIFSVTAAAWSSGGSLNTARSYFSASSQGTQDAAVVFGGNSTPNGQMANSESYNGSTWTATPSLNTGRRMLGGAGTQTAALAYGGYRDAPAGPPTLHQNITESWNGSTWTTLPATMPIAQNLFASFGSQTAAVAAAGTSPAPTGNSTQLYNGSTWTTSPATVNTARFDLTGCGSQTAGLIFGGFTPPAGPPYTTSSSAETWDGTSWTTTGSLLSAQRGMGGAGTQTAGLGFGGGPPEVTTTVGFDGSVWSTRPSLSTARYALTGAGIQTAALAAGGANTADTAATEEFNGEIQTATASTLTTS